jgi:hypothetical protein
MFLQVIRLVIFIKICTWVHINILEINLIHTDNMMNAFE